MPLLFEPKTACVPSLLPTAPAIAYAAWLNNPPTLRMPGFGRLLRLVFAAARVRYRTTVFTAGLGRSLRRPRAAWRWRGLDDAFFFLDRATVVLLDPGFT